MTSFLRFSVVVLFSVSIFSCGDDDDGEAAVDPREQAIVLLTGGSSKDWQVIAQLEGIDGEDISDACQRDDVWTFDVSDEFTFAANQLCFEGQDSFTTIWAISEDAQVLTLNQDGQEFDNIIIELTETRFVLEILDEPGESGEDSPAAILVLEHR